MDTASVKLRTSAFIGAVSQSHDFLTLLRWLILMCVTVFGFATLWQLRIIQAMFQTDRTHISALILLLFVLTSLHCMAQTWYVSKELAAARQFKDALSAGPKRPRFDPADMELMRNDTLIARHAANLATKARVQGPGRLDQTVLLRVLANRLRGRERLGFFVSEALLRLALLGTAVGFILMLIPMAGLTSFDAETLRQALSGMSGGMAVALNITVTGIGAALLLKLQYYLLTSGVVDLYDMITEVTEVHVISVLERRGDA